MKPRVVFFQTKSPKQKILKLPEIAKFHFEKKEPFWIKVKDKNSLYFVDELLWKHPLESFLPHFIISKPSKELIALSLDDKNLNQAVAVFNLTLSPLILPPSPIHTIYEYDDQSTQEKKSLSEASYKSYREAGYPISLL